MPLCSLCSCLRVAAFSLAPSLLHAFSLSQPRFRCSRFAAHVTCYVLYGVPYGDGFAIRFFLSLMYLLRNKVVRLLSVLSFEKTAALRGTKGHAQAADLEHARLTRRRTRTPGLRMGGTGRNHFCCCIFLAPLSLSSRWLAHATRPQCCRFMAFRAWNRGLL